MFSHLPRSIAVAYSIVITCVGVSLGISIVGFGQRDLVPYALILQILLALASAVAIGVAARVGWQSTVVFRRLGRLAARLGSGEAVEPVVVDSTDEIADLADSFNVMAVNLQRKILGIEEQRAEAAAILDGMGDDVVIVDEALRVLSVNRAAEHILEVDAGTTRGASAAAVLRHHDVIRLLELGKRADAPLVVEIGRDRHQVQVVVTPVHIGAMTRQVILFQDVTELRRAETIRRDFVANVSHELRTPLTSLRLLVETLEGGAIDRGDRLAPDLGSLLSSILCWPTAARSGLNPRARFRHHLPHRNTIQPESEAAGRWLDLSGHDESSAGGSEDRSEHLRRLTASLSSINLSTAYLKV